MTTNKTDETIHSPTGSEENETETPDFEVVNTGTPSSLSTQLASEKSSGVFDMDITQLEQVANEASKRVELYKKIRHALLGMALPGDWQMFGQEGKQYLELTSAGTERYKAPFGVSVPPERITIKRFEGKDDAGPYFRYEVICVIVWKGVEQIGFGFAGSRDKFFGMKDSQWKPASELRETDIKQAAIRAAQKEGIKQLFGLRRIPVENAAELGLPLNVVRGHTFPTGKGSQESGSSIQKPTAGASAQHRPAAPADADYKSAYGKIESALAKGKVTFLKLDDGSEYRAFTDKKEIWEEVGKHYRAGAVVRVDYTVHPQYGKQILRVVEHKEAVSDQPSVIGQTKQSEASEPLAESRKPKADSASPWDALKSAWESASKEDRYVVCGDVGLAELSEWSDENQRKAAAQLIDRRENGPRKTA